MTRGTFIALLLVVTVQIVQALGFLLHLVRHAA